MKNIVKTLHFLSRFTEDIFIVLGVYFISKFGFLIFRPLGFLILGIFSLCIGIGMAKGK